MKIYDQVRADVDAFLQDKGTPASAYDVAFHLMPKYGTIGTDNIVDTLRACGYKIVGYHVYGRDE